MSHDVQCRVKAWGKYYSISLSRQVRYYWKRIQPVWLLLPHHLLFVFSSDTGAQSKDFVFEVTPRFSRAVCWSCEICFNGVDSPQLMQLRFYNAPITWVQVIHVLMFSEYFRRKRHHSVAYFLVPLHFWVLEYNDKRSLWVKMCWENIKFLFQASLSLNLYLTWS